MEDQSTKLETAKLAKEKGFNWETRGFVNLSQDNHFDNDSLLENYNSKEHTISIPTQSLLERWLREVHEIHVGVKPYSCSRPENFEYEVSILGKRYGKWVRIDSYLDYEDAMERGLEEALKLIK